MSICENFCGKMKKILTSGAAGSEWDISPESRAASWDRVPAHRLQAGEGGSQVPLGTVFQHTGVTPEITGGERSALEGMAGTGVSSAPESVP